MRFHSHNIPLPKVSILLVKGVCSVAPYIPTTADATILQQFTTYPYLTAEQITRLLYSKGSAHYVSAKLKLLTQQKFLHRLERETVNCPYVYCLGIRGIRYVQALGCDIPLFHPSEHTTHKPMFLRHTLAVNDFLIAAATLPDTNPGITINDIRHDLTLKRTPTSVIPDGWIDFRLHQKTQVCIWLEMDMGTMDQKPFRKKISSLIDFSRQSYEQVFGTPSLTIVFATIAGERRLNNILNWTQKELTDKRSEKDADLLRFLCIPEQDMCPEQVFLSPICVRPFDTCRVALIQR
jgi:Replication-relaxation